MNKDLDYNYNVYDEMQIHLLMQSFPDKIITNASQIQMV